jgi:uncharacterized protein YndB with AHSA1/START domain
VDAVVVEQFVPARRAAVRAAFLDPAELARWWWPHLPDVTYQIDPRAGGAYRIRTDTVGIGVHGEILTLGDGAAVLTWVWEEGHHEGPLETVTIQFADVEGGTQVTVTHPCADAANLRQGWGDVLARLAGAF